MKIALLAKILPSGELNPFDASAYEAALSLGAEVTLVTMGRESCGDILRSLTRLGAKRAVLLSDAAFAGADTLATAYTLSLALGRLEYDYVFCGRQAIDGETAQVGPCLASILAIEPYGGIRSVKRIGEGLSVMTDGGGMNISSPALLCFERSYVLRFPSLFSSAGRLEIWGREALNADFSRIGLNGSATRVLSTRENTGGRRYCRFIEPKELPTLIESLKKSEIDAKKPEARSMAELIPKVHTIGGGAIYERAKDFARGVEILPLGSPREIAESIKSSGAEVVLWNSDSAGRFTAPRVAGLLGIGLCADCTDIRYLGGRTVFTRPASGGSVVADIVCTSSPAMATVRCREISGEVILSLGRGALSCRERFITLARERGYGLACSRGLVDDGEMQYDYQVGLTGRVVSPRVYIAVGISGAVHHICGMERSGAVVAVNTDKYAPIFDYADYGIIASASEIEDF